jgi:hypothetical protein
MIWAALRFRLAGAALATFLITAIAFGVPASGIYRCDLGDRTQRRFISTLKSRNCSDVKFANESAPDSIESGRSSIRPPPKAAHYHCMLRSYRGNGPNGLLWKWAVPRKDTAFHCANDLRVYACWMRLNSPSLLCWSPLEVEVYYRCCHFSFQSCWSHWQSASRFWRS